MLIYDRTGQVHDSYILEEVGRWEYGGVENHMRVRRRNSRQPSNLRRTSQKKKKIKFPAFPHIPFVPFRLSVVFRIIMDDLDMDQVMEVPDTPDRFTSLHRNTNNLSPVLVEISDSPDGSSHHRPRDNDKMEKGIGQSRRPYIRPPKRIGNGSVNFRNPIIISPSDHSCTSHGHLSKKDKINRNCENEDLSSGAFDMDGNKGSSGVSSYKSFHCPEKGVTMKLKDRNGEDSCHVVKSVQALDKSSKGKEKANASTSESICSSLICRKGTNLPNVSNDESTKRLSQLSNNVSSPRLAGQKRLVRNGCISPHSTTLRDKQLPMKINPNSCRLSQMSNEVCSNSPSCTLLDEIVADEVNHDKCKGKGILLRPCTSKEHMSTRNSIIRSDGNHIGTANAAVDVLDGYENQDGWRSAHNQPRSGRTGTAANICLSVSQKRSNSYQNKSSRSNHTDDRYSSLATSWHVSDVNGVNEPGHSAKTSNTRIGRSACISEGGASSSRLDSGNPNVMLVGSSEDSPGSTVGLFTSQQRQDLGSILEFEESSPEVRQYSPSMDHVNSPDSDTRVRQMEADEMFALELQEQLYNESPMDEYLAQMLQQVEQSQASSTSVNRRSPVPRGSTFTRSQRESIPRTTQNIPHRRGRNSNMSMRNQPPRRGRSRRSSILLSRDFQFPLDMDLDMRIDILEALEDTIGDFDGIARPRTRALRVNRDFNENDYEMLLALDENVHHAGTSSNQINSLPESKVQVDVSEEACAICLDNPKFGETIRHLPCLHKFHKDCIDPWLSRSTSCPVCKSSVT
ncbi:hypothetical protein SAY86_005099 [Trapa natans]|uniref:RING-type domain-containing protein n=1 Tax=Trapa natans TaxID=22666 RepID=A0AAN7L073_TRANT|nr:hypothetical protein SAY86_005099 [Trapa natans]